MALADRFHYTIRRSNRIDAGVKNSMKILIWLISIAALGLAMAIAFAGPAARLDLWQYGDGLKLIRQLALPVMIAAAASAAAFIVALFAARSISLVPLAAAVIAGLAAFVPIKMKQDFEANPFIHDITTDFDDPPAIIAAANEERKNPPHYVGDEPEPRSDRTTAAAQRAAFPDIQPIRVDMDVETAAATAKSIVTDMGMKLLSSGPTDDGWVIEAAYTSTWFGFVDDFIVRVRPDGEGAIIDLRSKSRVGGSDLGANAKRIRTFTKKFAAAA